MFELLTLLLWKSQADRILLLDCDIYILLAGRPSEGILSQPRTRHYDIHWVYISPIHGVGSIGSISIKSCICYSQNKVSRMNIFILGQRPPVCGPRAKRGPPDKLTQHSPTRHNEFAVLQCSPRQTELSRSLIEAFCD